MKKIISALVFTSILFACTSKVEHTQQITTSEPVVQMILTGDPEVDQLKIDFAKACPFSKVACSKAPNQHDVYREADSHMPIAVPFKDYESLPQEIVAQWCDNTFPSKVHVDFVRYPQGQSINRVYGCVMDDYSPGSQ